MWLWLWGGCPVCALQSQSLQRGPQPAEMQALSGLFSTQPLPEGELLHHEQRRLRRLPARILQKDEVKWISGYGVHPMWRPAATI
ncbi:hypothetical protein PO909_003440 [Leuciscus waleckii]